jgi:hypothetical protein
LHKSLINLRIESSNTRKPAPERPPCRPLWRLGWRTLVAAATHPPLLPSPRRRRRSPPELRAALGWRRRGLSPWWWLARAGSGRGWRPWRRRAGGLEEEAAARGPWRHGGLRGGVERLWWRGRDFSGGCGGRWRATCLAAFLAPTALSHVVGFAVLSLDGAGSGWRLGSSASWPSTGWAAAGRRWLAEGWRSSEPTLLGLSSGEVLVSGGLLPRRVWR